MKNITQHFLILLTVLFIGLMIGILISRFDDANSVQLSAYERTTAESTIPDDKPANIVPGKININIATAKELAMLPGIGETTAQNIVDYRNQNGLFVSIDELEKVHGIGEKRIQEIYEYVTVGG